MHIIQLDPHEYSIRGSLELLMCPSVCPSIRLRSLIQKSVKYFSNNNTTSVMGTYGEGDNFIKFYAPGGAICRFEIANKNLFCLCLKTNRDRNLKLSTKVPYLPVIHLLNFLHQVEPPSDAK